MKGLAPYMKAETGWTVNAKKSECVLLGLSGLLIYIAWDGNFNMQVTLPVLIIFCFLFFPRSKGFNNKTDFVAIVAAIGCLSATLLYNAFVNTEIINNFSIIRFFYLIAILLYFYININRRYDTDDINLIVMLSIVTGSLISLGVLFAYLGGAGGKISLNNIWGTPVEENYTGSLIAFYFILGALSLRYSNGVRNKILILLLLALMAFAMMLTGCRAAFLGASLGLAVLFVQMLLDAKIGFIAKAIIATVSVVVFFIFVMRASDILPEFLYKRLFTFSYADSSNEGRVEIWLFGLKGFLSNPVFGYGIGNFTQIVAPALNLPAGSIIVAHNTYLDAILDLGILGCLPICYLIIRNLRGVFKSRVLLPLAICLFFCALIVGGERTFFFWNGLIILSIMSAYYRQSKSKDMASVFRFDLHIPLRNKALAKNGKD